MTTRQERADQVAQMLTNGRLEGLEPDGKHHQLLQAYIAGTAALVDLLEHAIIAAIEAGDDGQAAKGHLAAGRPIYYCEDAYSEEMIRKWPDGRRELVKIDANGGVVVTRQLPRG